MTRDERELARLLIADPLVRDAVRRLARAVLVAGAVTVAGAALLVLWFGGAR